MPEAPPDLLKQLQAKKAAASSSAPPDGDSSEAASRSNRANKMTPPAGLMAALQQKSGSSPSTTGLAHREVGIPAPSKLRKDPGAEMHYKSSENPDSLFEYNASLESFLFFSEGETHNSDRMLPKLVPVSSSASTDQHQQHRIDIPLAPCAYRLCDYTFAKKQPVSLQKCVQKLGVLRCLLREQAVINQWLQSVILQHKKLEDDELGKVRFMELLSNCGVYQSVSQLILQQVGKATDLSSNSSTATKQDTKGSNDCDDRSPSMTLQVTIPGLQDFLTQIDVLTPALQQARNEIKELQTVSFYPGLGELYQPGSKLLCHPDGMEGNPLGCSCVQSWYAQEDNPATGTVKRRFVLVLEFLISVGDSLVFVAASDVIPEFHDPTRNMPLKDLKHRVLDTTHSQSDMELLARLQERGEFYASIATKNHYLEYQPDAFFPILGGWNSHAVRPLSKGGRVMVDVHRGILENHLPIRSSGASASGDGMNDTVKEAIKLWDQSKRTGVAVPFRTAILPGFTESSSSFSSTVTSSAGDRHLLWMAWPMVTGFSFTARVWGKLLLSLPKPNKTSAVAYSGGDGRRSMMAAKRESVRKLGVEIAALGGEGRTGNVGYIQFQEQAFEQLVLAEDKKELIRAVARNAGGGTDSSWDDAAEYGNDGYDDDDDEDDFEDVGIDVVANKGGASIFLLHGPPGCGKTLTAEAISELLRKPLYIVTAGDLGITAKQVEETLGSVLDLCQTWDALVLIDEADVFLEARSSTEIERNALVCVILRLLEYYSGCLFLSSNRAAGSIDPAIASRITVMLGYPPLDEAGRAKVWKNLIGLVPVQPTDPETNQVPERIASNPRKCSRFRVGFDEEDYLSLAQSYYLNGRQIKNSIVLARALARERGQPLSLPILRRAVTAVAGESAGATTESPEEGTY